MYKVKEIFKTEQDAIAWAKQQGYPYNASHLYKHDICRCECGETEIAVFWAHDDSPDKELIVGICSGCGEEY